VKIIGLWLHHKKNQKWQLRKMAAVLYMQKETLEIKGNDYKLVKEGRLPMPANMYNSGHAVACDNKDPAFN